MTIKEVTTKTSKSTLPLLIDDNNQIVMEVYRYMKHLIVNNYSKNTISLYCYYMKTFYEWLSLVGLTYHTAIAPRSSTNKGLMENLTNYKTWLKYGDTSITPIDGFKKIRDPKTINNMFDCILSFYDFLVLDENLPELNLYKKKRSNPKFGGFLNEMLINKETTHKVHIFKERVEKKGLKYVTREEYEDCYLKATNLRDKVLVSLLFECGLRVSEVIGLTLDDFKDIMDRKITIVNHHDKENIDSALKYDSSGTVFVTPRLQQDIMQYINEFSAVADTNYFLFNLYGETKHQPMRRKNIERIIKGLGKKIGKPDLHPHAFRHGLAVDMLSNGCTMVQIKDTLRHKNISTTMDIYAEYNQTEKRNLMDKYHQKIETKLIPDGIDIDEFVNMILEDEEGENDYE